MPTLTLYQNFNVFHYNCEGGLRKILERLRSEEKITSAQYKSLRGSIGHCNQTVIGFLTRFAEYKGKYYCNSCREWHGKFILR